MTNKNGALPNGTQPQVLRNIVMQAQVHVLSRPGKTHLAAVGGSAIKDSRGAVPQQTAAAPHLDIEVALEDAHKRGYDAGWAESRKAERDAEFEATRRQGFEQGLQEGCLAGQEAAAAAMKEKLVRLDQLLDALPAQIEAYLAAAEDDVVALCFEVISRVLGEQAATADGIRGLVTEAVRRIGAHPLAAVHLHPGDLDALHGDEAACEWLRRQVQDSEIQFVADGTVELGGAVLRSSLGSLDARLETQIEALRHTLLAVRSTRHAAQRDAVAVVAEQAA